MMKDLQIPLTERQPLSFTAAPGNYSLFGETTNHVREPSDAITPHVFHVRCRHRCRKHPRSPRGWMVRQRERK
jgi:hypothetical protein